MTKYARPNWAPGEPEVKPEEDRFGEISEEEMKRFPSDYPDEAFIVVDLMRPNVEGWVQELETTHYPPDTAKNAEFEFFLVKWPKDVMMLWAIIGIPLKDIHLAEELAKKYKLHLTPQARPMVMGPTGPQWFPIDEGKNVYTVQGGYEGASHLKKVK